MSSSPLRFFNLFYILFISVFLSAGLAFGQDDSFECSGEQIGTVKFKCIRADYLYVPPYIRNTTLENTSPVPLLNNRAVLPNFSACARSGFTLEIDEVAPELNVVLSTDISMARTSLRDTSLIKVPQFKIGLDITNDQGLNEFPSDTSIEAPAGEKITLSNNGIYRSRFSYDWPSDDHFSSEFDCTVQPILAPYTTKSPKQEYNMPQ